MWKVQAAEAIERVADDAAHGNEFPCGLKTKKHIWSVCLQSKRATALSTCRLRNGARDANLRCDSCSTCDWCGKAKNFNAFKDADKVCLDCRRNARCFMCDDALSRETCSEAGWNNISHCNRNHYCFRCEGLKLQCKVCKQQKRSASFPRGDVLANLKNKRGLALCSLCVNMGYTKREGRTY